MKPAGEEKRGVQIDQLPNHSGFLPARLSVSEKWQKLSSADLWSLMLDWCGWREVQALFNNRTNTSSEAYSVSLLWVFFMDVGQRGQVEDCCLDVLENTLRTQVSCYLKSVILQVIKLNRIYHFSIFCIWLKMWQRSVTSSPTIWRL